VNPNFRRSRPHIRQGPEIRGRFVTLNQFELITNIRPSFSGKPANTIQRVTHPVERRQIAHASLYPNLYIGALL
jgi:hypothetical protein